MKRIKGAAGVPRMTPARRRGLLVLLTGHERGRPVAVSNQTTAPGAPEQGRLAVYWQTVRWLVEEGLAVEHPTGVVELTDAGRERAQAIARAKAPGGSR